MLDLLAAALVAGLFVHRRDSGLAAHLPGQWSLVPWALDYLVGLLLFGRTLGMYLTGLRVIRVDADAAGRSGAGGGPDRVAGAADPGAVRAMPICAACTTG